MSEPLRLVESDGHAGDDGLIDGTTTVQRELGPFWLDPDEMLARLPAVAASMSIRQETIEGVAAGTYNANGGRTPLADTYLDLCWYGGCLLETPDGKQQFDSAVREISSFLEPSVRARAVDEIVSNAQYMATLVGNVRESAGLLTTQVKNDILSDRDATFDLIAYIADIHSTARNRGSDMTADLLNCGDSTLLPHLYEAVKSGEYDDVLYGRLVRFIRRTEDNELSNGLLKISEIMTLTSDILQAHVELDQGYSETIDDASIDAVMLRVVGRLPVQYRSHFSVYKEGLLRAFEASLGRSIESIKAIQNSADPRALFIDAGNRYIEGVRVHHLTVRTGRARGVTMLQDPRQKAVGVRSRMRAKGTRGRQGVAAVPSEEMPATPWELVRLWTDGNGQYREVPGDGDVDQWIKDYFDQYDENPEMRVFLKVALERLTELDLSRSPTPGYKKLGNGVKIRLANGLKPVFEYIPGADPNISITAPDANLVRVLVVNLGQHRFGIVTVIKKPDAHSYFRNRGMGDTQNK